MNKKRGQIATEYLIIVSFVVFLVISVLGIGLVYSAQAKDRIRFNYLINFGNKIVSSSESVFFSGEPSKVTLVAYLPSGVEGLEISGNELIFDIVSNSGKDKISFSSDVIMQGEISFSEGVKRIVIEAGPFNVTVSEDAS